MLSPELPEWAEPLFEPYRYKGAHGGRGSAKSHSFASALTIKGVERPISWLCAREIQKSIKDSVKKLLEQKIETNGLTDYYHPPTETEIRGKNGTSIIFAGLRSHPDSIKSIEGLDGAWVEEAHKVSQRSLDILVPTVRKPGSELWFTWNPELPTDPIDKLLRTPGAAPPRSWVTEVNYWDNPWFPDVLREEMEWDRKRDLDKYLWVWEGKYQRNSEARVFKNWRVEPFETPADARFYLGADWGFSVDPSVLVRCWIDGRTLYVDYEAYAVGCEIDHTPFLFAGCDDEQLRSLPGNDHAWRVLSPTRRDLWTGVPGARQWPIKADSARPETISYMVRHGFPNITKALKGPNSVMDGIEFLKSFDIVVHPRCRHTADELATYSWKLDPLTNEVLPVLDDKKNHVIDALRYAVEAQRRAAPQAAFGRYR
jgi:phage terminase large subunit